MSKLTPVLLIIIAVLLIASMFIGGSDLHNIKTELEAARTNTIELQNLLKQSQSTVNEMKNDLTSFKAVIDTTYARVELNDARKRVTDKNYEEKKAELQA